MSTAPSVPRRGTARARLLDAAGTLFYRDGINTTGVEAIAGRAGVTKATLYNNFRGKDDLVTAYLQGRLDAVRAATSEHDDPAAPASARVGAVFDALSADIATGRFHGCPFAKAAVEVPGNAEAMAVVRDHRDLIIGHLTQVTGDPETAETIAMIYDGAVIAVKATGDASRVAHARDAATALVADEPED